MNRLAFFEAQSFDKLEKEILEFLGRNQLEPVHIAFTSPSHGYPIHRAALIFRIVTI